MNNKHFIDLEDKLSSVLKPVKPDPVFLDSLKTKLNQTPSVIIKSTKNKIGIIVVGAGFVTGALTLWIVTLLNKMKK